MKATPRWENAALLLAAAALWPRFILRWTGAGWTILGYATLAVLVVILIRRVTRFRKLLDRQLKGGSVMSKT